MTMSIETFVRNVRDLDSLVELPTTNPQGRRFDPAPIIGIIRSEPETLRRHIIEEETPSEIRKKIEKHIKKPGWSFPRTLP